MTKNYIFLFFLFCHLSFYTGIILSFRLLGLGSNSGEVDCLLLEWVEWGGCSHDNSPSAADRGRVSAIGVKRVGCAYNSQPKLNSNSEPLSQCLLEFDTERDRIVACIYFFNISINTLWPRLARLRFIYDYTVPFKSREAAICEPWSAKPRFMYDYTFPALSHSAPRLDKENPHNFDAHNVPKIIFQRSYKKIKEVCSVHFFAFG